jgi:glycosyltransferase involved in cell wall biosynthesis
VATKKPLVSVVIPAYNEASYIDRLLEALSLQDFKDFEVIVSDAQSKDGTKEVVQSFKDQLDIKFVESPPKGPGHGRNIGAKLARGKWLLFLDADDDIDDPDFIKTLLAVTEKRGWQTSSAKMKSKLLGWRLDILYTYQKILARTKRPVASGWCIFTKRAVFEKSGGFSEQIQFGEDYEYVSRSSRGSFGFVDQTYYYVDPRRNESEGFKLMWKGTLNEVYRFTRGYKKLESNPVKYEFGKHKKRSQ